MLRFGLGRFLLGLTACVPLIGEGQGEPGVWTRLTLLEGPESFHDTDTVSAIYFESLNNGFIGTRGAGEVSALYLATATEITDFAFDEVTLTDLPGGLGDFAVRSIFPYSGGIAVTTNTSGAWLHMADDFATAPVIESTNLEYGIAPMEGLFERNGNWVALVGSGVVATATEDPSPGTRWTETWAPQGGRPPAGGCLYGPRTRVTERISRTSAPCRPTETRLSTSRAAPRTTGPSRSA